MPAVPSFFMIFNANIPTGTITEPKEQTRFHASEV
jgi:hypothetical protein